MRTSLPKTLLFGLVARRRGGGALASRSEGGACIHDDDNHDHENHDPPWLCHSSGATIDHRTPIHVCTKPGTGRGIAIVFSPTRQSVCFCHYARGAVRKGEGEGGGRISTPVNETHIAENTRFTPSKCYTG